MKKKKPRGSESPNIIVDYPAFSTKQFDYLRCCMNCLKRRGCKSIPPKNSIKRWKEFCAIFLPNYQKIDRERAAHNKNPVINPDSPSGRMLALRGAGDLLERVEQTLNSVGGGGGEGMLQQ